MKTIYELQEEWAAEESRILTETFDIRRRASEVDFSMSPVVKEALGPQKVNAATIAERHDAASNMRDDLRAQYEVALAEYQASVEARVDEVEGLLAPKNASAELLFQAAAASEEALRTMAQMSIDTGNEDGVLVALKAARERDLDSVEAFISGVREDIEELLGEIALADSQPDYGEAGSRFEMLAASMPEKGSLLKQPDDPVFPHSA